MTRGGPDNATTVLLSTTSRIWRGIPTTSAKPPPPPSDLWPGCSPSLLNLKLLEKGAHYERWKPSLLVVVRWSPSLPLWLRLRRSQPFTLSALMCPGSAVGQPVYLMLATAFSATTFGEDMASPAAAPAADAG